MASGGRYDLRVVQSGAKASRINVAVALDGEKALGSSESYEMTRRKWFGSGEIFSLFIGVSQTTPEIRPI